MKKALEAGKATVTLADGRQFDLTPEVLTIPRKTLKTSGMLRISPQRSSLLTRVTVREFTPNVIEPSFGLGRILYTLLEHSFWIRAPTKDGERAERGVRASPHPMCSSLTSSTQVLSLPPLVAPTKVLIVPLSAKEEFDPLVAEVCAYRSCAIHPFPPAYPDPFPSRQVPQSGHLLPRGRLERVHR